MTASRVFTGKSPVATTTRERVLTAAQRLGYRPNHLARSLRQSQTRTLGMVITAGMWYAQAMRGAEEIAREHGYTFLYTHPHNRADREQERIETLRQRRVDGLLMMSGSDAHEHGHLRALHQEGIPLVTINRYCEDIGFRRLFFDYRQAACSVVQRWLAAGHRRVGFVGGTPDHPQQAVRERIEGYRKALREAGAWMPAAEGFGGAFPDDGEALTEALLRRCPGVTALLAVNDYTAAGALRTLRRLQRRVPEDVAVVGFDDTPVAFSADPPLSAVRHSILESGRIGCRWLVGQIEPWEEDERTRVLPSVLVVRRSCGLAVEERGEQILPLG
jgi:LacI family transcriptional regulator